MLDLLARKKKSRTQTCEIFTDDGRIVDYELDVLRGCVDDPTRNSAFLIDFENQMRSEDGQWHQILGERSTMPIFVKKEKPNTDLKSLINQIFAASYESQKRQQFIDALKDEWKDKIIWLISIPCCTLLIFFLINKLSGGD